MTFTLDLNTVWYILITVLLSGYAILDGFDLGVGPWHILAKSDVERRTILNAIGPVWDGNEVWLITGGGALFAAFPAVYATAFSGFYLALMLLLLGLIFRAVAIDFRGKQPMAWWRQVWDISFGISSILVSLLLGVALGNVVRGIPLNGDGEYLGGFWNLLNPYSILLGLLAVALFAMHGGIYLLIKTEGELQKRLIKQIQQVSFVAAGLYILTVAVTFLCVPLVAGKFMTYPGLLILPLAGILATVAVLQFLRRGRFIRAFLSSCAALAILLIFFAVGLFPNLIFSPTESSYNSLTIYNAASSQKTLKIMLIIAAIGMPLVIAYTISIYRIFRGKVKIDAASY